MAMDEQPIEADESSNGLEGVVSGTEGEYVVPEQRKSVSPGTVLMGGLIALAAAGVYLMHMYNSPASANAAQHEEASRTIDGFLSGGPGKLAQMQQLLQDTQKVVTQFLRYPAVTQVPLESLKVNPFAHVSRPVEEQPKVVAEAPDEAKQREEAKRRVTGEARALAAKLQSTIAGSRPTCLIDGRMYEAGEKVDSFDIEEIRADAVVVRQGQFRFVLKLSKAR